MQSLLPVVSSSSSSPTNPCFCSDRPRILICAPSNTAVDELVYRILTQGVLGSDGQRTDINIVRIGHALKEDYLKRKNDNISAGKSARPSCWPDALANPLSTTESYNHLVRVVERVSLDNIVEDRARMLQTAEKKAYGVHFKPAEIRKQVLAFSDAGAALCPDVLPHRCWSARISSPVRYPEQVLNRSLKSFCASQASNSMQSSSTKPPKPSSRRR